MIGRSDRFRVFVSYTTADTDWAQKLTGELRASGFDAWIDRDGIRARELASSRILDALNTSVVVLIVLSTRSAYRHWVVAEIREAIRMRLPIIAVAVDPVWPPSWLRRARIFRPYLARRPDEELARVYRFLDRLRSGSLVFSTARSNRSEER